jgi:hypothetical protein
MFRSRSGKLVTREKVKPEPFICLTWLSDCAYYDEEICRLGHDPMLNKETGECISFTTERGGEG